jgi:hypothetical protein
MEGIEVVVKGKILPFLMKETILSCSTVPRYLKNSSSLFLCRSSLF